MTLISKDTLYTPELMLPGNYHEIKLCQSNIKFLTLGIKLPLSVIVNLLFTAPLEVLDVEGYIDTFLNTKTLFQKIFMHKRLQLLKLSLIQFHQLQSIKVKKILTTAPVSIKLKIINEDRNNVLRNRYEIIYMKYKHIKRIWREHVKERLKDLPYGEFMEYIGSMGDDIEYIEDKEYKGSEYSEDKEWGIISSDIIRVIISKELGDVVKDDIEREDGSELIMDIVRHKGKREIMEWAWREIGRIGANIAQMQMNFESWDRGEDVQSDGWGSLSIGDDDDVGLGGLGGEDNAFQDTSHYI